LRNSELYNEPNRYVKTSVKLTFLDVRELYTSRFPLIVQKLKVLAQFKICNPRSTHVFSMKITEFLQADQQEEKIFVLGNSQLESLKRL
jgi:hypothetical protein